MRRDSAGGRLYCNPPDVPAVNLSLYRRTTGDWLRVQTSFPKLLYSSNVPLIDTETELQRAIAAVSIIVSDITGIDLDFRSGNVVRLDAPYNWQMSEQEVFLRLQALRNVHVPRLQTKPYEHGIYLMNKSEVYCFYSKHSETTHLARKGKATTEDVRQSVGLLRGERRFIGGDKCKREAARFGCRNPTVGEFVRMTVGERMVNEAVSSLGLDKSIEAGDSRFALLFEQYGLTSKTERLVGFLYECDQLGAENLIKLGYCKEKFRRNQKAVAAAGAWSTNQSRRALAPLHAVRARESSIAKSINV